MHLDNLIISKESLESEEKYDLILSNIQYVNALFNETLTTDEMPADALKSYYVDAYLLQINNGGFAQFISNISADQVIIDFIYNGLKDMGAVKNADMFEKMINLCNELGSEGMEKFFNNPPWGDNPERDFLNQLNDEFHHLQDIENILDYNYNWLRFHPKLQALSETEIQQHVEEIGKAIPDKEERIAASQSEMPRYTQVILALCHAAGQELLDITMGDPSFEYQGEEVISWHFITDAGLHYMIELEDKAIMFNESSNKNILELSYEEIEGSIA